MVRFNESNHHHVRSVNVPFFECFNSTIADPGGGVLVLDALTLAAIRDSGPVLPSDVCDLAVSTTHDLVLVVSPEEDAVLALDVATLKIT